MIRVQSEDFDIGQEIDALTGDDTGIGGVCTFTGTVRDVAGYVSGGKRGNALSLGD